MGSKGKHAFVIVLRYIILIAIVAVLVLGVMYFLDQREVVTYEAPHPAVVIQQPVLATIEEDLVISGYIEAEAMIPVVPLVPGTIMEYRIQAGDYVSEGDVIAVIDKRPYEQQMLQAEAAYLAYENTFQRVKALYEANATTKQNYDQVKAQRDAGLAQYDLAKLQLGYAEVTAPVSGTILMAPSAKGSIGAPEQPLAIIANLEDLVVRLNVPEKYFDLFSKNKDTLKVQVIRPASGTLSPQAVANATIETIAPYVEPQSKVFKVVCRLEDNLEAFRPGMYVKVSIIYQSWEGVPTVPQTVRKVDGSAYIYHPDTNTVSWIDLQPVAQGDDLVAVPSEYATAWFVVDGQHVLFDGQQVTVKE